MTLRPDVINAHLEDSQTSIKDNCKQVYHAVAVVHLLYLSGFIVNFIHQGSGP